MKTLRESILNRSSHGGEGFKAQRREMIEDWLNEYNIKNYTINDDFTIDIDGDVNLVRKNLMEFPDYIQFGIVKGNFNCYHNHLTSLKGAPKKVGGNFICSWNNLTSLKGAPETVGGGFNCGSNQLTSLEGAPKKVGDWFLCGNNQLTSLEGVIEKIGGSFDCSYNELTSLKGAPKEVRGNFDCRSNSVQFTDNDVRMVCKVKGIIITRSI